MSVKNRNETEDDHDIQEETAVENRADEVAMPSRNDNSCEGHAARCGRLSKLHDFSKYFEQTAVFHEEGEPKVHARLFYCDD